MQRYSPDDQPCYRRQGSTSFEAAHLAHVRSARSGLTIAGWSQAGPADIELCPGSPRGCADSVKVRLTDLDVSVYTHVHYVAHRHECASQTCIFAWNLATERARRGVGSGPYYSLYWLERDTPAAAILTHSEDILKCVGEPHRADWQMHALTPSRAADWRIVQSRYPDAGEPMSVVTFPWPPTPNTGTKRPS